MFRKQERSTARSGGHLENVALVIVVVSNHVGNVHAADLGVAEWMLCSVRQVQGQRAFHKGLGEVVALPGNPREILRR